MKNNRDDFSRTTIETLAKRVGYLCSNPKCRKFTIGSHEENTKTTTTGIAAHIEAASIGGKRYNVDMQKSEREDLSNGIWLCSNCATLIDKDHQKFPVALLKFWKELAEDESAKQLNGNYFIQNKTIPYLEADLTGWSRGRTNMGVSYFNPTVEYEGRSVIEVNSDVIIFWDIHWRYSLVIHNNSSYPAYRISVESVGDLHPTNFEQLPQVNNLPALHKVELKLEYNTVLECNWKEADAIKKPRFPDYFKALKLRIKYLDETREIIHSTLLEFENDKVLNTKENPVVA